MDAMDLRSFDLEIFRARSLYGTGHAPVTRRVRGARAIAETFPGLPQVASSDTSFHRTMPEVAQTYALGAAGEGRASFPRTCVATG
jgi:hypothetical protein